MATYAAQTEVPADRTRQEIERTLARYGATSFLYGWEEDRAMIGFRMAERTVRMLLPLPARSDFKTKRVNQSAFYTVDRTKAEQERAYDLAVRQRWRALALVIKAKLEAVDAGITTLESEFLADIMLPNGQTVGEWTQPQLMAAYAGRDMPKLLPLRAGEGRDG